MGERKLGGIQGRRGGPFAVNDATARPDHPKAVAPLDPAALPGRTGEAQDGRRPGLAGYLQAFPGGGAERDRSPSRDVDL